MIRCISSRSCEYGHDVETYGTTEAGGPVVSTSCPYSHDRDEIHLINEDTVLTEILDPETMKPVA
ncbi:MAG: hypothetical protein P8Z76_16765, partial [Alphaproteobacteria bacterium]